MFEDSTTDDLRMIFDDSLIIYKKEPVMVKTVIDRSLFLKDIIRKKELGLVPITDNNLDFTPVKLGFCNEGRDAFYVTRAPLRQYKQGLCRGNLNIHRLHDEYDKVGMDKLSKMNSEGLVNCILGRYPNLNEAIELITENKMNSVAFNRFFAIDSDFRIYHRNNDVGILDPTTLKIITRRSTHYVQNFKVFKK